MSTDFPWQSSEKSPAEKADELYSANGLKDFIFELDWEMFRCKVGARNTKKVKSICTAKVALLSIVNKGSAHDPFYHYLIRVQLPPLGESIDVLLSPSQFSSHTSFKRVLMAKRTLFTGTKGDYGKLVTSYFLTDEVLRACSQSSVCCKHGA